LLVVVRVGAVAVVHVVGVEAEVTGDAVGAEVTDGAAVEAGVTDGAVGDELKHLYNPARTTLY